MKQFFAKVISNKKIAQDHYVLSFNSKNLKEKVKPGQFFNIKVGRSCELLLRRPFGAHKIKKDRIEILYKVIGKATQILSTRKKGNMLDVIGPLGNGFNLKLSAKRYPLNAILVAGGHGVAPLYALAKRLAYSVERIAVSVFIGAKIKEHIICDKEFRKLGAKVYVATENGSKGYKGFITELLSKKLKAHSPQRTALYACGPKPMLKEVAKIAKKYKIPCQVSIEEYIACGIGTCLGCAVRTTKGYKLVCKDGPVFDAGEIVWT